MKTYTPEQVVKLAKRANNPKRSYLLVNPLQAKHMPIRPGAALEMMSSLGERIARCWPEAKLVIGFAETATAIGAAVAVCLGTDCVYLHTTREPLPGGYLPFQEEHSHAVEQRLYGDRLADWIEASPQIILVDDEISTGKTMLNIVHQMRARYPQMAGRGLVAASIINRLSAEDRARLQNAGIESECLVWLPNEDLTGQVARYQIEEAASEAQRLDGVPCDTLRMARTFGDPRRGVPAGSYREECRRLCGGIAECIAQEMPAGQTVLVLGTEECMYPALLLGHALEALSFPVCCHATTRSPIGICPDADYPIQNGYRLRSFYDAGRKTFLYNLRKYQNVILVTDSAVEHCEAAADLARILKQHGCGRLWVVEGGKCV